MFSFVDRSINVASFNAFGILINAKNNQMLRKKLVYFRGESFKNLHKKNKLLIHNSVPRKPNSVKYNILNNKI